jgi:hypothetical protein
MDEQRSEERLEAPDERGPTVVVRRSRWGRVARYLVIGVLVHAGSSRPPERGKS